MVGSEISDSRSVCASFLKHISELVLGNNVLETMKSMFASMSIDNHKTQCRRSCNAKVSFSEHSLSGCARNKSPGFDGLFCEFYWNMPHSAIVYQY